jgi:hypothetical protein
VRVQYAVRFSIAQFEGKPDDQESPHVWARNDKVVIKGRGVRKTGQVNGEIEYREIEGALAAKGDKGCALTSEAVPRWPG